MSFLAMSLCAQELKLKLREATEKRDVPRMVELLNRAQVNINT